MNRRNFHENFPVTAFLLLFATAFFALELMGHRRLHGGLPPILGVGGVDGTVLLSLGANAPGVAPPTQVWRLLTAAFLHGGFLHILMNGWILFDLGRVCEPLLSRWKFLVVYVLCAIGGSLGTIFWSQLRERPTLSVGASGALMGLLGLLLVYSTRHRLYDLRNQLIQWAVMILILSFLGGGRGIDHAAHAGGFVTGCLLGFTVRPYLTSAAAARWRFPGYLVTAALIVSLGIGIWDYFQASFWDPTP